MNAKSTILISAVVLSFSVHGGERDIQHNYPLEKLSANVYVIHGPNEEVTEQNQGFRNNPVVITTEKGAIIVDPGSSVYTGEMVVRKLKEVSEKPVIAVINSHGHGDHWLGNHGVKKHFPDVSIYSHPLMKKSIETNGGEMWIKAINQRSNNAIEGTQVVAPNKTVNEGDEMDFGNITLRVYYKGKAHSDGDIMLEVVQEKVFLFGDVLRVENISPFMASLNGNLAALDIGEKTGANIFVPGHGKSGDKRLINTYRKFLQSLKAEVKNNFESGLNDFEMKPKIIKAMNGYKDWSGLDENIGRLINLVYLEVEEESF
ncbi:MAG: MBL fold metallo-hydrolase [Gammaproteobacteria bacterium]|nr:MBL fold metallo-hydrolase [Gammaproteobacteria bacterium]